MDHGTGERPMVVALNRQAKVPDRVGRFRSGIAAAVLDLEILAFLSPVTRTVTLSLVICAEPHP